jgi:hypothetical protein
MGWFEMSRENLLAARLAHHHGYARSAVSRAYFSAYAALAGVFEAAGTVQFRYHGANPGHRQLLALTANNLDRKRYAPQVRRNVKQSLRILQSLRINADYNPDSVSITNDDALICVRNASAILLGLEVLA